MIFFDNIHICPTPNYYVQKLFSVNHGDNYFDHVIIKDVIGVANLQQFTLACWVKLRSLPSRRIQAFIELADQKAVVRYDGILIFS